MKEYRVMNIKTGKVRVVTSAWMDNAKKFGIFSDFELIGEVKEDATIIIEDIPTVYIPPNPTKEIDNQIVAKKKGRKPKQK